MSDISILIPLYNEVKIFPQVLARILETIAGWKESCEVIVVDDGSTDGGHYESADTRVRVLRHPVNLGNGAAIKTAIRNARGKYCIILDADGQHDIAEARVFLDKLVEYPLVVGARNLRNDGALHRNFANRVFSRLASYMSSYKIEDLTSGFRAFHREPVLELIHLFPNRFSCPTTMTMGMIKLGYPVLFLPIHAAKRVGVSKISIFRDGVRFFLIILKITTLFSPMRIFFPLSFLLGVVGLLNYVLVLAVEARFSLWSLVMFTSAITIFMMGLVAEEISTLNLRSNRDYRT